MDDHQPRYVQAGIEQMAPVFDHGALVMSQNHASMIDCPAKEVPVGGSQQPGILAVHQIDSLTEPDNAFQQGSVAALVGKKG